MARRRKSLLHGMSLEDVVSKGILKRVLAKDNAVKSYVLGYKRGNADFAGWLLYLSDKIEAQKDRLLSMPDKERALAVMDIVSKAAKEWEAMKPEDKEKWIARAKEILAAEKSRIEADIKMSDEIEKLAEEAYKGVEELVATIVS